ncbi:phosphomannomutase/phosphoglucomutase [Candidatus Woesearchaeota archaeon]|nr:phosphomannomutase/phosphoglucomutase [Candidatus Woesearchaeota archaeon]
MAGIFKSYDIRGVYGEQLDEDMAYKIGRAFVTFLKVKKVVVGRDTRLSSDSLFESLAKGITDQGADVIDVGLCSSPMLNFAIAFYDNPSGIMITASHNPKEYNGFKLAKEKAQAIAYEDGIDVIEKLVEDNKFEDAAEKGSIKKKDIIDDYVKFVLKFAKDIKPLKVVIDATNGMASLTAPVVFKTLPCDVVELFFGLDGNFPNHEPNPLNYANLESLRKKVIDEKADVGIAFDGDADRLGFVDEKGEIVGNDIITIILAKYLLNENPGSKIIYDLRSTHALREIVKENKGIPLPNRVGHAHIKKRMKNEQALFGGELSGHYFFRDFFNADCAMIAAMEMLNILSQGRKLSEIVADVKRYASSPEINFEVEDKEAAIKRIEEKFKDGKKDYMDGATIEFDDWWFNLRESNTEPLLRLRVEAKTADMLKEKTEMLEKLIKA